MSRYRFDSLKTAALLLLLTTACREAGVDNLKKPEGITEKTPSRSNYFDWINSEWPGSRQEKVMANLEFFEWLHEEYGMQLDIYHMDAGNIDRSPYWIPEAENYEDGLRMAYGHIDDARVREKFPDGFKSIVEKAKAINTRMGIWLGPDGYGTTEEEAQRRSSMLVDFCKDYNFALFKFDAACSNLNPANEDKFVTTMKICRSYVPDLITLNHRITLSDSAKKHMTTWLWEGKETYIDVHIWNETPAPHHRAGALSRGLPPNLSRLTEDHGVCISSCLDYWEDDLILQAFNRNLILAPEIYGNPWLLKDEEFPILARIFNLHKKYNQILIEGIILPEDKYGPYAVSRGNDRTRLVTLRNLSWDKRDFQINLSGEIGLGEKRKFLVMQLHPTEKVIGFYPYGDSVKAEVSPFRSSLILVTADYRNELLLTGTDYRIIRDIPGHPVEIELLGFPGETKSIRLYEGNMKFTNAVLDGDNVKMLLDGKPVNICFSGDSFKYDYHRRIGQLVRVDIPEDWKALYEATCFAADNNALEVRSLLRSGPTTIPQVEKARQMFFNDPTFRTKGIWDRYAFDNDTSTSFKVRDYRLKNDRVKPGALRVNFGEPVTLDKIILTGTDNSFNEKDAWFSVNLQDWKTATLKREGGRVVIDPGKSVLIQYLMIEQTPLSISEIEVYSNGKKILPDEKWKISNLFSSSRNLNVHSCWYITFVPEEIAGNSYLCVVIPGKYGNEGVWAALKINGNYKGCPDRSPSFISNHWEHVVVRAEGNYTYYFPLTKDMTGKSIEVYVLGFTDKTCDLSPELWITAYPVPFVKRKLILFE